MCSSVLDMPQVCRTYVCQRFREELHPLGGHCTTRQDLCLVDSWVSGEQTEEFVVVVCFGACVFCLFVLVFVLWYLVSYIECSLVGFGCFLPFRFRQVSYGFTPRQGRCARVVEGARARSSGTSE